MTTRRTTTMRTMKLNDDKDEDVKDDKNDNEEVEENDNEENEDNYQTIKCLTFMES